MPGFFTQPYTTILLTCPWQLWSGGIGTPEQERGSTIPSCPDVYDIQSILRIGGRDGGWTGGFV